MHHPRVQATDTGRGVSWAPRTLSVLPAAALNALASAKALPDGSEEREHEQGGRGKGERGGRRGWQHQRR